MDKELLRVLNSINDSIEESNFLKKVELTGRVIPCQGANFPKKGCEERGWVRLEYHHLDKDGWYDAAICHLCFAMKG